MKNAIKTFAKENKDKIIKKMLIFIGGAGVLLGGVALAGKIKDGKFEDESVEIIPGENGEFSVYPTEEVEETEEGG